MPKLYASRLNLVAMELLLARPVSASEIDPDRGESTAHTGWRVLERFEEHGLVEYSHKGDDRRHYWMLTEDGYEQARLWDVRQRAVQRGECCEDAVLGIEGDHAPYCPFIGATSTSSR